jgi:hypothetical protein
MARSHSNIASQLWTQELVFMMLPRYGVSTVVCKNIWSLLRGHLFVVNCKAELLISKNERLWPVYINHEKGR